MYYCFGLKTFHDTAIKLYSCHTQGFLGVNDNEQVREFRKLLADD